MEAKLNAKDWNYYDDGEHILIRKKKIPQQQTPTSFEELDMIMRKQGLFY